MIGANHIFPAKGLLVLATAALLALNGCSDDDPVQVEDDRDTGPETPRELVSFLLTAYEARDADSYLALLDPEFRMLLTADTINAYPHLGEALNLAEETRIHRRLFSGEAVTDPHGDLVPGIEEISFSVFQALSFWSESDDTDNFPDTVWAPYQVLINFFRGQNFSILKVQGVVKIYARFHEAPGEEPGGGYYFLAGMTDQTHSTKGVENFSWGSVKALYH